MWRRVMFSWVLVASCTCTSKRDEKVAVQPARGIDASVAKVPHDTWSNPARFIDATIVVDAKPLADGEYATVADRYLAAYLDLLWVDLTLHEMLQAYPGVPATNRYASFSVEWKQPDRKPLEAALRTAKLAAERADGATDRAVLAYTTAVLEVWPSIDGLAGYYKDQRFVDDEFARGRREQGVVRDAMAKVAPLRKPMADAVFAGWRVVAGDKPESPRAILGASFEACMRVATLLFDRPRDNAKPDPKAEAAIDDAMGACRRGVGAVSALPEAFRSFDEPLRRTAIEIGNAVDTNFARQYAIGHVERLVKAYTERWPKLPSEPAERPVERVE